MVHGAVRPCAHCADGKIQSRGHTPPRPVATGPLWAAPDIKRVSSADWGVITLGVNILPWAYQTRGMDLVFTLVKNTKIAFSLCEYYIHAFIHTDLAKVPLMLPHSHAPNKGNGLVYRWALGGSCLGVCGVATGLLKIPVSTNSCLIPYVSF